MNSIMNIKDVLQKREEAILSMEKKLNISQTLNKTLLSALERSISGNDILSYDERRAIKQETKDCLSTIDNELQLEELRAVDRLTEHESKIESRSGKIINSYDD